MNLVSRAVWSLVGSLAYLGAVANAAGVLEISVVFPRNETYAPIDLFPVVFALQNAELAKNLNIDFRSNIRNASFDGVGGTFFKDLTHADYSSEPYLVYYYETMNTDGTYDMFSTVAWVSCNENGDQVPIISNDTRLSVDFTIKNGGQQVDLVAATAKDKTCSAEAGVAINVTDQTREFPDGTCAVLASSSPTPTASPCRVQIDTAADASMSASWHDRLCRGSNPPADCPEENAVQQLAVVGVAIFAAAFGAAGLLLA